MNRIVMASDGDLNVGISSEDELNAFVSEKRGQGTYLSVLGFGSAESKLFLNFFIRMRMSGVFSSWKL